MSKKLYEIRLKYFLTRDKVALTNDTIDFMEQKFKTFTVKESKLDEVYKKHKNIDSIVIFGSGSDGKLVLRLLRQSKYSNIKVFFCDNDKNKWNTVIDGVSVLSPSELFQNHDNSIVIVGSRLNRNDIYKQLVDMSYPIDQIIYPETITAAVYQNLFGLEMWHLPTIDNFYDKFNCNVKDIIVFGDQIKREQVIRLLRLSAYKDVNVLFCNYDDQQIDNNLKDYQTISMQELIDNHKDSLVIIETHEDELIIDIDKDEGERKLREKIVSKLVSIGYPFERILHKNLIGSNGWSYFDCFEANEHEIFVDGGSFDGKTALDFSIWADKGYDYIYSFEANPTAVKTCEETFKENALNGEVIHNGLWNKEGVLRFHLKTDTGNNNAYIGEGTGQIKTVALDDVLNGKRVSFIKFDIEGAEYKALLGARETIKKWRPRLAICIYHKSEDIVELPALILDICEDYKFTLRQYASRLTSTVLYAY